MYKVYINETPLFLSSSKKANKLKGITRGGLVTRYSGKAKMLLNYVDMLEKSKRFKSILLYSENKKKLIADFQSCFSIIEAAGGLVYNKKGKVLLIYRLGFWDLPKGKFEDGETKKECAIREVMEETGLKSVKIEKKLDKTFHTYRNNKVKRKLKKVYWYRMLTSQEKLTPQLEEDILEAKWWDLSTFLNSGLPVYGNIRDILKKELKKQK